MAAHPVLNNLQFQDVTSTRIVRHKNARLCRQTTTRRGATTMSGFIIFTVLFGVGVIVSAVWLVVRLSQNNDLDSGQFPKVSALDILQRRYARGELSAEEYAEKRADIWSEPATGGK